MEPAEPSPPPRRPTTTLFLGIVGALFGVLVACYSAYEIVGALHLGAGAASTTSIPGVDAVIAEGRAATRLNVWRAGGMIALSAALVVASIGLTRGREPWRRAMILWACVALVSLVARAALWELAIGPHYEAMIAHIRETSRVSSEFLAPYLARMETQVAMGETTELVTIALLAIFPLAVLQVLTREKVKEQMRA